LNKEYSCIQNKKQDQIPLIANIPHSSTRTPEHIRASFLLNDDELHQELLRMTDRYTDKIFSRVTTVGGTCLVYGVSRLVVDPERFEDDAKEKMARKGMGVIYTKTSDGRALRDSVTNKERKQLLDTYYRPYHKRYQEEVQRFLDRFNTCMIIDCHSFPSKPLPFEDASKKRPDICIGISDFHTPSTLIESIKTYFKKNNMTTQINEPFDGTYVPMKFYKKERRVLSVMIEVNRRLYMDEMTGERSNSFNDTKNVIDDLIDNLIATSSDRDIF
jgi:N-formylglutamate deformylase